MYKFRTMQVNAVDLRNEDGSTSSSQDDPRLTKLGKFLRSTSIDELPQIINVIKGDMSFIGPRPDLAEHRRLYEGNEERKLEVRPGITGYNQAYYRNTVQWKERIRNDIFYIDHLSFWLDLKIFFKTLISVLKCKNIYFDVGNTTNDYKIQYLKERSIILSKSATVFDLEWDTEFFGIACAKAVMHQPLELSEWDSLKEKFKRYRFVSIENRNSEPVNAQLIGKETGAFLADVNIQFTKPPCMHGTAEEIDVVSALDRNDQILDIARFQYSKFIDDEEFKKRNGDQIYKQWLINSFGKTDKYFALLKKEKILGFLLFSFEERVCTVELIAVAQDVKYCGIGTRLFNAAENEAYKRGCDQIRVGTQARNADAINFYHKVGCRQVGCHQIYHLWNELKG